MGFPSLLFFQCRVKTRVPLGTTPDSPETHWKYNIPIKQSASLPGYTLSPCGKCTPPGGHFCVGSSFLPRSRRPGNKFPHSLIIMNHLLQRLAAVQIPQNSNASLSIKCYVIEVSLCWGVWESKWNSRVDSVDVEDHHSKRCAHNDSWAHPFCPAFDVGVSSFGWSTNHMLGHLVNIFSKVT